ncbi:MAG: dipeptidase PepV [Synergistaceae bacterium]|jgi:succinyl-diaminopimelate desuccinylase|nr:dipeptidase PepV [Synergistaceae bacterium]
MKKSARDFADINFEDQIRDTREIIKIPSVFDEETASPKTPFGAGAARALEAFLRVAEKMGFRVKNIDNSVGYAEIGEGEELAGILAHLDVMPAGRPDDWKYPPFDAVVENGTLWGRGAVDDKGPAMAALYALKALKDAGVNFTRRFRLILGLDEENGSRCIKRYNETEEPPVFSFSPDASFPVVNAEKGILRLVLTKRSANETSAEEISLLALNGGDRFNVVPDYAFAFVKCGAESRGRIKNILEGMAVSEKDGGILVEARGTAAHAMEPEKGDNAVQKILRRLKEVDFCAGDAEAVGSLCELFGHGIGGEGLGIASEDEISGPLTCNTASVETRPGDRAGKIFKVKLDIRYPVTLDSQRLIENIARKAEDSGFEPEIATHKPPLYVPKDDFVVKTLLDAYESVTGDRPAPVSMGGGTYCRFMPNSVSFGPVFPGQPELAHQANERIQLEDLRKCTHIYAEALLRFNERVTADWDPASHCTHTLNDVTKQNPN